MKLGEVDVDEQRSRRQWSRVSYELQPLPVDIENYPVPLKCQPPNVETFKCTIAVCS